MTLKRKNGRTEKKEDRKYEPKVREKNAGMKEIQNRERGRPSPSPVSTLPLSIPSQLLLPLSALLLLPSGEEVKMEEERMEGMKEKEITRCKEDVWITGSGREEGRRGRREKRRKTREERDKKINSDFLVYFLLTKLTN